MTSVFSDRSREYTIRVRRPEVELEVEETQADEVERFKTEWQALERRYGFDSGAWRGEDYAIARNLVGKWGLDKLRRLAQHFFWLEVETSLEGPARPMVAFVKASGRLARGLGWL